MQLLNPESSLPGKARINYNQGHLVASAPPTDDQHTAYVSRWSNGKDPGQGLEGLEWVLMASLP